MPHLHDLYKDVAPFDAREASTILTTTAVLLAIITVGLFVAPTLILGWLPVVLLIATCVFTAAAVVLRFQRPSELTPDKGPADSHNPRLSVVTGRSAQVRGMTGGHELRMEPDSLASYSRLS